MKLRRLPTLTSSVVAFFAIAVFATAGSLTPPGGPISSTMNSLEDLYASIVGGFDSTGVIANQNGSLIEHLKYIEANMSNGGVGSDSLDFDEFVDAMTLDADTSIANDGFLLTFENASISGKFGPSASDVSDLGSNDLRFRGIYIGSGALHLGETGNGSSFSYDLGGEETHFSGGDFYMDETALHIVGDTQHTFDVSTPDGSFGTNGTNLQISNTTLGGQLNFDGLNLSWNGHAAIGNLAFLGDLFGGFPGQTLVSLHEEFTDLATFGISAGTAHTYDLNPSATATDVFFGEDVFVRTDGTNTEDFTNGIVAGRYYPIHLGSGTVSQMDGLQIQPQTDNGTVTQMRGLLVSNSTTGTGDIGTAYAVYVGTPLGVGGISNNYGLYVADQSGAALSDFNVYSAGANSRNVFEGYASVSQDFEVNGHTAMGNVGGVDSSPTWGDASFNNSVLGVNEEVTSDGGLFTYIAGANDLQVNLAANSATWFIGGSNSVRAAATNTGDIGALMGQVTQAVNSSNADVGELYGTWSIATNIIGSGNVTNQYGVLAASYNSGTGTVANSYVLYADNPQSAGAITNRYGLYVGDQSAPGVANGFNIYSVGADTRNVFEGSASVGGNFELTGGVSSNLTPTVTDTFDLGTSALRWRDLYLASGSLHIGVSGDEAVVDYNVNDDYLAFKPDGVNTRVAFTDSGFVGISDSAPEFDPINPAVLGIARTFDDTLNQATGLGVGITIDEGTLSPGFSRADAVVGEIYTPDTSVSNFSGQLHGGHFLAEHDGSGIADYVQGSEHYVINGGPGTITSADAGFFQIKNTGTGDITNAQGIVILPTENSGGGTIGDNYGLYLHDQSGIGTGDNFNLFSVGATLSAVNYFGGAVGIGTLVPAAKVDIYSGTDEALRLSYDSDIPYGLMINNLTFGSTDDDGFGFWQSDDGSGNLGVDVDNDLAIVTIQTTGRVIAPEYLGFIDNPSDNRHAISGIANITGNASVGSQDIVAAGGNVQFQATTGTTDRALAGSFVTVTTGVGGGTINNAIGINGGVQGLSSSAIGNAYGGIFGTLASASTAITNSYGISIDSAQIAEAGTIDNNYGLYINDQAGLGTTLNYNIFSAGTGINYFEGPIVAPGLSANGGAEDYVCRDTTTGEITFGGTCTPSSIRFKKNVEDLEHGLDWVRELRPVTFDWKRNGEPSLGFIAEEVNGVSPLLAIYQDDEVYSVNYQIMTSVLAKAIQELDGKVENLSVNGTMDFDSDSWFQGLFTRVVTAFKDVLGIEFESGGRIRANELCLDDVCVTKDQLRDLLDDQGGNVPTPSDTPTPSPTPEQGGDDEPGPTNEPTVSQSPTPSDSPDAGSGDSGEGDQSSGDESDGGAAGAPADAGTPENGQ